MKLADHLRKAISQASSPEDLTRVLVKIAEDYLLVKNDLDIHAKTKKDLRDAGLLALDKLETPSVELDTPRGKLKVQRYAINKLEQAPGLVRLVMDLNLDVIMPDIIKLTVDEELLMEAVEKNLVSLEQVHAVAKVKQSEGFRVDPIKRKEGESE